MAQFHAELVRLHQQRRGLLVLDLDHTLVHCTRKKVCHRIFHGPSSVKRSVGYPNSTYKRIVPCSRHLT